MTQRDFAIMRSRQERAIELLPLRTQIDDAIEALGWRRAKPIVCEVLGLHITAQRGEWWAKVGKRNGAELLTALRAEKDRPRYGQGQLF
jgi:hypothetical protein